MNTRKTALSSHCRAKDLPQFAGMRARSQFFFDLAQIAPKLGRSFALCGHNIEQIGKNDQKARSMEGSVAKSMRVSQRKMDRAKDLREASAKDPRILRGCFAGILRDITRSFARFLVRIETQGGNNG